MPVCIHCQEWRARDDMGRRGRKLDPRCRLCIAESCAISQNYRHAMEIPIGDLRRKIRTTENLLATLRAALEEREDVPWKTG